jgi:hypothetical protein
MENIDPLSRAYRWCTSVSERKERAHAEASDSSLRVFDNDPSAGSPTETLLRLLLPLNDQV